MITAKDDIDTAYEHSCTVDVAVAKLLGWMRGPIRSTMVNVTEDGVIAREELPFLPNLEGPLFPLLNDTRKSLHHAYADAFERNSGQEIIDKKCQAVEDWDEIIRKANLYMGAVIAELAKGENSVLIIDPMETAQTGEDHITIDSLDVWAKAIYGISIDDPLAPAPKVLCKSSKRSPPKEYSESEGPLSAVSANSVFTTLAFAVDAIVKANPTRFEKSDNRPNVSAVAAHISKMAKDANGGVEIPAQQPESIKDRIERAQRMRRQLIK